MTCLGESTEKYIAFSVPIEKNVIRIDKSRIEITKYISYRKQLIDSEIFLGSSWSDFVNNPAEVIHRIQCKYKHDKKTLKIAELNTKIASAFLSTQTLRMI